MGRKGNWFSSVKKSLSPEAKEKKDQNSNSNKSKKKWFGKQKHPTESDLVSSGIVETQPQNIQQEEVKLPWLENEENNHDSSVEVDPASSATISAADVTISAENVISQAATEIVQPTMVTQFAGKSREEVAAIKIQTAFRGYMARRALRALRGLMRLKTLMESSVVKRQAANTLKCMQTLARVQSHIRFRRVRMIEENQALQKQLLQKHAKELENLQIGEEWDDSIQSKEQIEASLLSKYEAAMRRERALAYAFSHQKNLKNSSRSTIPMFIDPTTLAWGWSWLERWTAARQCETLEITERNSNNNHSSIKTPSRTISSEEISRAYAKYRLNCETTSPAATPKSNLSNFQYHSTPFKQSSSADKKLKPLDGDNNSVASMQSERLRRHSVGGSLVRDDESIASSCAVPAYMTPTQSARAKSRLQNGFEVEKTGTPKKAKAVGPAKKRLSYPPSPKNVISRRHSGPPKMDTSFNGVSA